MQKTHCAELHQYERFRRYVMRPNVWFPSCSMTTLTTADAMLAHLMALVRWSIVGVRFSLHLRG